MTENDFIATLRSKINTIDDDLLRRQLLQIIKDYVNSKEKS